MPTFATQYLRSTARANKMKVLLLKSHKGAKEATIVFLHLAVLRIIRKGPYLMR